MWLTATSSPDHNTIARFKGERLMGALLEVLGQVAGLLVAEGRVGIKNIYTSVAKIEANANKYTFERGWAIKASKERISKQFGRVVRLYPKAG